MSFLAFLANLFDIVNFHSHSFVHLNMNRSGKSPGWLSYSRNFPVWLRIPRRFPIINMKTRALFSEGANRLLICLMVALARGVCNGQSQGTQTAQVAANAGGDFAITQVGPHSQVWQNSSVRRSCRFKRA
jgi:hypothetical protein